MPSTIISVDPVVDRFWSKVEFTDTCWLWTAYTKPSGYGQFQAHGRTVFAHRYAYEFCVGPIPEGLELDHLCRVRNCVFSEHLEPVTHRENQLRGEGFIAIQARQTHCKRGHLFDAANTYITSSGGRGCRACHREGDRRFRQKQRGPSAVRSVEIDLC